MLILWHSAIEWNFVYVNFIRVIEILVAPD